MTKNDSEDSSESGVFRPRFTIPGAYGFVRRWIDAQAKPSVSFVLVLRDWIERNGYIDVMNRPVEQLPRKGRPPGSGNTDTDESENIDTDADASVTAESEPKGTSAPIVDPAPPVLPAASAAENTVVKNTAVDESPTESTSSANTPADSGPQMSEAGRSMLNDLL